MPVPFTKEARVLRRARTRAELAEAKSRAASASARERSIKRAERQLSEALNRYKSADFDRTRPGSRGPGGAPWWHLSPHDQDALRRDCQQLVRDNPVARALVARDVDLTVGLGPVPECQSSDPKWNKEAEAWFASWATSRMDYSGQHGLRELCAAFVHAWHTAGDLGLVKLRNLGKVQLFESEQLGGASQASNTPTMIGGVELTGPGGPPKTYHIGEWSGFGSTVDRDTRPVPAQNVIFLPNPRHLRPGQVRGEPALQSAAPRIERLDSMGNAVVAALSLSAMAALVFTRTSSGEGGIDDLAQPENVGTDDAGNAVLEQRWSMGTMLHPAAGVDVKTIKPEHPSQQYEALVFTELSMIAADLGVPVSAAFFRFVENYAADRSALAVAWRGVAARQAYLRDRLLQPLFEWAIAWAIQEGELSSPPADWQRVEWAMAPQPVLDPKAEYDAALTAIDGNLTTAGAQIRKLGLGSDHATIVRRRGKEIALEAEAGAPRVLQPGAKAAGEAPPTNKPKTNDTPTPEPTGANA